MNVSRGWISDGITLPIAVNISARDLQDESFPMFVAATLAERGVDAAALSFEITERALMDNLDATAQAFARYKKSASVYRSMTTARVTRLSRTSANCR